MEPFLKRGGQTTPIWTLMLALTMFLAAAGLTQIDTPSIPPERDTGDLFKRVSGSQVVFTGTVAKSTGVSRRLSDAEINKRVRPDRDSKTAVISLDNVVGGSLYEVRVKEILCRATNFKADFTTIGEPERTVRLFVPRDEPLWKDGRQKEALLENHEYLLFLVRPSAEEEKQWLSSFQLDASKPLYRGHERSRGIVPLATKATNRQALVLDKVRPLCEAVRPSAVQEKLAALKRLTGSSDEVLQREAQIAIEHFERALQRKRDRPR